MRIFFCFSSKDRHSIVESLLYHLDNYSIPVWYDRREMLMGDPRNFKNFIEGVGLCNYAIIILSPNSIASKCANEEIILIKDKYEKGQMTVFPIFFNITADSLDNNYLWMKQLVYKELVPEIDSVGACNHIVCKILLDELSKFPILTLNDYISKYEHVSMHCFFVSLMKSYMELYGVNYNARLALLFAAYSYLIMHFDTFEIPQYYYQGIHHLFNQTKLLLSIENREILIAERSLLLLLNASLFGNFVKYRDNSFCQ